MFKYKILFDETTMGCQTLGRCPREGRDRVEEERRYADFLRNEGYDVIVVEEGYARVRSDAGGIIRHRTLATLTKELADVLDGKLADIVKELSDRVPTKTAGDLARGLDLLNQARNVLIRSQG